MKISEKIELNKISIEAFEKLQAEVEFYNSLKSSIRMAGGCTDWLDENTTLKELADCLAINGIRCTDWLDENTTLKELADCLAIKGIRFTYIGERGRV